MREQSFNGLPTPSAFFDPDTCSWRTSKDSLLKEDLTSLERLQPFGMTVAGRLYELATPEHLISVRDGSQSRNLPTPTAQAAKHGATPDKTANAYGKNLWDIPHLLPTPTTQDAANNAGPAQWKRNSLPLNCIAVQIGENGSPPSEDGKPSDK